MLQLFKFNNFKIKFFGFFPSKICRFCVSEIHRKTKEASCNGWSSLGCCQRETFGKYGEEAVWLRLIEVEPRVQVHWNNRLLAITMSDHVSPDQGIQCRLSQLSGIPPIWKILNIPIAHVLLICIGWVQFRTSLSHTVNSLPATASTRCSASVQSTAKSRANINSEHNVPLIKIPLLYILLLIIQTN